MKKEVIVAIVSGLVLGLIVTLGIFTANRSLEQQKAKKQAQDQTNLPPSPPLENLQKSLQLTSHKNFDLINQSSLTLSGVAWPDAIIALMTENNELMTQADEEGDFSFNTSLIKGFNELTLVATDETGDTQTLNIVLTYSTSKIEIPE